MMKKKSFVLLLSFILILGGILNLAGCGAENAGSTEAGKTNADSGSQEDARTINVGVSVVAGSVNAFLDENDNLTGYEVELVHLIEEKLPQYKINLVETDFASLFVALDSGKLDIAIGNLRRSDEREANYIHTYRAYNYTPYVITVLDTVTDINGIEDLDGKKVGISQGSLQATILEHYQEENNTSMELVYTQDGPNDLVSKRIDALVGPLFSIQSFNASFDNVQFKAVGDPIVSKEGSGSDNNSYFWLSKGSEGLRDEVSEAIYSIRQEGKLSELIKQFYETDYTQSIDESKEEEQMEALGK